MVSSPALPVCPFDVFCTIYNKKTIVKCFWRVSHFFYMIPNRERVSEHAVPSALDVKAGIRSGEVAHGLPFSHFRFFISEASSLKKQPFGCFFLPDLSQTVPGSRVFAQNDTRTKSFSVFLRRAIFVEMPTIEPSVFLAAFQKLRVAALCQNPAF